MTEIIKEILEFCEETGIEIVSYGLAPNPNGFCFEVYGDACSDEIQIMDEMLCSLSSSEEIELKAICFGGE